MLLNSWKIYDPKEGDDDGLGTFYNGEGILEDLFSTYNYYKSPMLNQWYFNKERDNPFAFLCYIFAKGKGNNLVMHPELIERDHREKHNRQEQCLLQ